ncbi:FAD-binding protein [Micromonospora sp. BL1]|uniref:GMC family oxidoreductase N-terminal domain-containing protein n=1 Tax=Micromonospora sp. BL1 TaxID=2478709 RepID=UPI000EF598AA|nr:GMC family oxidoreductase N-terminal domain-containing protein [Micromonospora sp. BL1]NED57557.1 FAD-binding protein [Micromonospora aurantiaca]RLQ06130.1 FAD-binding protein [Micromonospora sp. BL1]
MHLSDRQRAALASICDTFAPGDGAGIPSASRLGATEVMAALVLHNPRTAEVRQFLRLLDRWDSPVTQFVLGGCAQPFSRQSPQRRERTLLALAHSRVTAKRALFQALKGAATLSYYLTPGPAGHSPVWDAIGYPGPLGVRADAPAPPLTPVRPSAPATLDCDVVVVGSGAGGGTAAAVLAGHGLDVVVVEKGGYYDDRDFDGGELSGLSRLYAPGPAATAEGQLSLLQGQCLGGGTVVNYTTSFPTPARVREEWAALGVPQFATDEYDGCLDAVWTRLGVNREHGRISSRDALMERGLNRLGWHVDEMPRNVDGCDTGVECGRCGLGCRIGAKRSATKTWLADAERAGARLVVGVDVRAVTVEAGRATGVTGHTADGHPVAVRARAVVVAAGSVQTPALLRRSGLTNPNIGRHLHLHPATGVWGVFAEEVRPWEGGMQTRYSTEHADLDGRGYGVIYETAATNPATAVSFMSWTGGRAHLDRMRALPHLGGVGVITRDRDSGEVRVGRDGEPVVHYRLSPYDAAHLRAGIAGAARIVEAAGALRLWSGHQRGPVWERGTGSVDEFVRHVETLGTAPGQVTMAALHIMGAARMGGSAATSVARPDGATWEVPNLVLADASTFPGSLGVNPMISVEAIAYMNAQRLAAAL